MFSTRISPLIDECAALNEQVYELNNQIIEVEQVIRQLDNLKGLDGFAQTLRARKGKFEENIKVLNQMARVLDKSVLYYLNCENKICENGEQSTVRYHKKEQANNDLNEVADVMKNIEFN